MLQPIYLTFSDTAKYADIARNILEGHRFVSKFSFFNPEIILNGSGGYFSNSSISPIIPYLYALSFKFFGVYDWVVVALSFFFFLLSVFFGFLLARKLFGKLVGLIYVILLLFSQQLFLFAQTASSEIYYIFEIILTLYLMSFKSKIAGFCSFVVLVLMYFTRPQAIIIIPFFIAMWFFNNYPWKLSVVLLISIFLVFIVFDTFFLRNIWGQSFFYSSLIRFVQATRSYPPGVATSNELRGGGGLLLSNFEVFRKTFYNLYNFYRLVGQYMSPVLFAFYVFGLVYKENAKQIWVLKLLTFLMLCAVYVSTAATIPLLRYLQPLIPIVYLFAAYFVVLVVRKLVVPSLNTKIKLLKIRISRPMSTALLSISLVVILYLGLSVGYLFLDSRFDNSRVNKTKPPIYVVFSQLLKDNTNPTDIVLTNLDTWGTWYGNRTTVWYPLSPSQILQEPGEKPVFDYIYLTNYLIDDENYYMSDEWRQVLHDPKNIQNNYLADNYYLAKEFEIGTSENYQKTEGFAVLLRRK